MSAAAGGGGGGQGGGSKNSPSKSSGKKKKAAADAVSSIRCCANCGAPEGSLPGILHHKPCGKCLWLLSLCVPRHTWCARAHKSLSLYPESPSCPFGAVPSAAYVACSSWSPTMPPQRVSHTLLSASLSQIPSRKINKL